MQKIYFNEKTNHTIIDVSSIKNPKKISKEFNVVIEDYQSVLIDEFTEMFTVVDGKLFKITKNENGNN